MTRARSASARAGARPSVPPPAQAAAGRGGRRKAPHMCRTASTPSGAGERVTEGARGVADHARACGGRPRTKPPQTPSLHCLGSAPACDARGDRPPNIALHGAARGRCPDRPSKPGGPCNHGWKVRLLRRSVRTTGPRYATGTSGQEASRAQVVILRGGPGERFRAGVGSGEPVALCTAMVLVVVGSVRTPAAGPPRPPSGARAASLAVRDAGTGRASRGAGRRRSAGRRACAGAASCCPAARS